MGDGLWFLNVIFASDNELQAKSACTNPPLERDSENSITNQVSGKMSQAVEKKFLQTVCLKTMIRCDWIYYKFHRHLPFSLKKYYNFTTESINELIAFIDK